MPKRIQRRRTKGWWMPDGAIYVGRPTKWGNPWTLAEWEWLAPRTADQRDLAVACFRDMLDDYAATPDECHNFDYPTDEQIRTELAGHDLVCWCPLDEPCHADVLLELANRGAQ